MIEVVIDQRRRSIGSFEVGRVLPSAERHMVGPFIFFDHFGPVDLPKGLRSFCRTGANPFRPTEVVAVLREVVLEMQRRVEDTRQPQE